MAHDFGMRAWFFFDGRSSGGLDPRGMLIRESACAAVDHPVLYLVVPEFCNPRFQQGGGWFLKCTLPAAHTILVTEVPIMPHKSNS